MGGDFFAPWTQQTGTHTHISATYRYNLAQFEQDISDVSCCIDIFDGFYILSYTNKPAYNKYCQAAYVTNCNYLGK